MADSFMISDLIDLIDPSSFRPTPSLGEVVDVLSGTQSPRWVSLFKPPLSSSSLPQTFQLSMKPKANIHQDLSIEQITLLHVVKSFCGNTTPIF